MGRPRDPGLAARLFGQKPEHTLALLRAAWPGAVGDEIARRSEVVALDRGVLRIKVPDMRWQRTLVRMRGFILSRLARVAGQAAPRALGFVTGEVADPGDPAPAPGPARAVAGAPALVVEAAQSIPDDEIRARFLAAAGRYLARFGPPQAASGDGAGVGSGNGSGSGSNTG
jgi:Dna[CI] antecedent, DciA